MASSQHWPEQRRLCASRPAGIKPGPPWFWFLENILNAEFLRSVLSFNRSTGVFVWNGGKRAGREAGYIHSQGYRQITINGKPYYAHRLAWLYETGSEPATEIDHIDGNRLNNRICNLREVAAGGNQHNQRNPQARGSSGFLGVSMKRGRFRAAIKVSGKTVHIGTFDTAEQAHSAYVVEKRRLHPECTI